MGREAVRLIRSHDPATPLFLYVPFLAAHTPMEAPPGSEARYAALEPPLRRTFAAMVTAMDDAIGEIVAALDETGMRENTLLLFASDNGANEAFGGDNAPLRGGKYRVYEGGVRVPALASWPGVIEAGRVERGPIHVVDLFPTLLGPGGRHARPVAGPGWAGRVADPGPRRAVTARRVPGERHAEPVGAAPRSLEAGGEARPAARPGRRGRGARGRALRSRRGPGRDARPVGGRTPRGCRSSSERLRGYEQQAVPPLKPGPMPKGFRGPPVWGVFGDAAY